MKLGNIYRNKFEGVIVEREIVGTTRAESFFGSLKREMEYNYFYKIQEAEELLFDHIEVYYNRHRSHSSLDFVSPVQFEVNAA
ncbi:integrase core domain protein [Leptospira noguchii str. 2001034031]|uniref:Integrase core domain protein n=1 Tax=Leptospira noguchii str. 2001034031 TaxID=1193053 RepID=M6YQM3_9LEPT|nr:integrase core domain protein [Leptospira noguchii str. 2001034031]